MFLSVKLSVAELMASEMLGLESQDLFYGLALEFYFHLALALHLFKPKERMWYR